MLLVQTQLYVISGCAHCSERPPVLSLVLIFSSSRAFLYSFSWFSAMAHRPRGGPVMLTRYDHKTEYLGYFLSEMENIREDPSNAAEEEPETNDHEESTHNLLNNTNNICLFSLQWILMLLG